MKILQFILKNMRCVWWDETTYKGIQLTA